MILMYARAYDAARERLNDELDEFDSNPKEYVKRMGWVKPRQYEKLRKKIDFSILDVEDVASSIVGREFSDEYDLITDDKFMDALANKAAELIIKARKKANSERSKKALR